MRSILRLMTVFLSLIILQTPAHAALDLMLTKGMGTGIPIAIVPFAGDSGAQSPDSISTVVMQDLQNSGQFKVMDPGKMTQLPHDAASVDYNYWRKSAAVDNVVVGNITALGGGQFKVNFALMDVFKNSGSSQVLASNSFTVSAQQLRPLAHHISDIIYQQLTGVRGVFSTHIAYVLVQRAPGAVAHYTLQIADEDGFNPRTLLTSTQPIMSPAWSHDGKRIAYVSFEKVTPQIFIQDVASGSRYSVSNFPGVNGAPAWSPNDNQLAIVLSKGGTPKIYILSLASRQLTQITQGNAIDTEPEWSPDGRSMIFTSDRGGGPQIYQRILATGDTQRITFKGDYNARASFSPDGKYIVMINRESGAYNIAMQDLSSGNILILTRSGYDASPSLAPNGRVVLFESQSGVQGTLGMVSIDGRVQLNIPAPEGSVQDPAWSPFLS